MKARALSLPMGLCTGLALAACDDHPPVVRNCFDDAAVRCPNQNDPSARIEGTLTYQGPPPALDANGVPSGRVVMLLFYADNSPAPEGSATTALSFQTIGAAQLFRSAAVLPGGLVRASIGYSFPGITAGGVYQIRAFYSRGDAVTYGDVTQRETGFHPLFGVRNQPILGDVGGGAVIDPTAAIARFARITLGTLQPDGSYAIPTEGYVAGNVSVFLGRVFTTERPMFRVVTDATDLAAPSVFTTSTVPAAPMATPGTVPPPGDALERYARDTGLLPEGSVQLNVPRNQVIQHPDTGADLPSFTVQGGLPTAGAVDECLLAALAGVRCATDPMTQIGFVERAFDRNQDGSIGVTMDTTPPFADAHPTLLTSSPLARATMGHLPWVYPLVILTKLHEPTEQESSLLRAGQNGQLSSAQYVRLRTSLNQPEGLDPVHGRYPVLLLGTVLPNGSATNLLLRPWSRGYTQSEPSVRIGIIPIAIEVHGFDQTRDWWAVLPPSSPDLIRAVAQFLPEHYRCWDYDADWELAHPNHPQQAGVPVGRYAINVINESGQAWTVPNDLAAFPRPSMASGTACSAGQCIAPSQSLVVRVTAAIAPPIPVICPAIPER